MPARPPRGAAARVRHAIALDATNVVERLRQRQHEMVALFSRLRDRAPLLLTLHTAFDTIGFSALASLDIDEQDAVNTFYRRLADLRWYAQFTEDMPGTVEMKLSAHLRLIEEAHAVLTRTLKPARGRARVVDAEVVARRPRALAAGRARRSQRDV